MYAKENCVSDICGRGAEREGIEWLNPPARLAASYPVACQQPHPPLASLVTTGCVHVGCRKRTWSLVFIASRLKPCAPASSLYPTMQQSSEWKL